MKILEIFQTTQRRLAQARIRLQQLSEETQKIYGVVLGLRKIVQETKQSAVARAQVANYPNGEFILNATGAAMAYIMSFNKDLANACVLLELLEKSPEYKEAAALIEPLITEIKQLEKKLADDQKQIWDEAEAAKKRYEDAVNSPNTAALRRELEEAERLKHLTTKPDSGPNKPPVSEVTSGVSLDTATVHKIAGVAVLREQRQEDERLSHIEPAHRSISREPVPEILRRG